MGMPIIKRVRVGVLASPHNTRPIAIPTFNTYIFFIFQPNNSSKVQANNK